MDFGASRGAVRQRQRAGQTAHGGGLTALDDGQDIPMPSHIEALRMAHPEFEGWLWAPVKVDPAMLDDVLERVNISLPRRVLRRLDARARRSGETRSGFIARMSIEWREQART